MSVKNMTPQEAQFRKKCLGSRLRVTSQRLAIFGALQGSKQHPSAETVYRKIRRTYPHISFDTVNRTLLLFARMGILKIVEGRGNPKRFDPDATPHHHFHCVQCNRIIDFKEPSFNRLKIPGSLSQRFEILDKRIVLTGICEDCLK